MDLNPLSKKQKYLPFDILGLVFTYYVETETLFHSLETLRLVSRQWNLAALGHKALWGKLHIHLGHKPTHDAWKILLPRRLERAGLALLSIEIRYALEGVDHPYYAPSELKPDDNPHPYYDDPNSGSWTCAWNERGFRGNTDCSCIKSSAGCATDLLRILAGSQGEYCKRWTKLHITLGGEYRQRRWGWVDTPRPSLLCDSLSYPTPLLEGIFFKGLGVLKSPSKPPFPSTPSVRIVHFDDCVFDSLDGINFSSAESITFWHTWVGTGDFDLFKFNPPTAIKLLDINGGQPLLSTISRSLPHLHTLHLGAKIYSNNIIHPDSDFPSLETLTCPVSSIGSHRDSLFMEMFSSSTKHLLSTVKVLTLSQFDPPSRRIIDKLKPFLDKLYGIERITASHWVLGIILKYLLEANMRREESHIWRNLSGRTLELVNSNTRPRLVARLVFDETMHDVDICAAGRELGVRNLKVPWEQY